MNNKKNFATVPALACALLALNISAACAAANQAPAVIAKENSVIYAENGDTVIAEKGSVVIAKAASTVMAKNGSQVTSMDGSTVKAYSGSHVTAEHGSTVYAYADSKVIAEAKSMVYAYRLSYVVAYYESQVNAIVYRRHVFVSRIFHFSEGRNECHPARAHRRCGGKPHLQISLGKIREIESLPA